jgi:predicted component of type VI protein secretion system
MNRTLLEKLDSRCHRQTLQQSVCQQVQRILATRSYRRAMDGAGSFVVAFGIPELLDQFKGDDDAQRIYRQRIREQLLALEPRLTDVDVKAIHSDGSRAHCQLILHLGQEQVSEHFYF